MSPKSDPTEAMRAAARDFPETVEGTSCNQASFKVKKKSFFFVGPGARGQGFKAMLKLGDSLPEAQALAAEDPDRFQAGKNGWVTLRFTAEKPIPKKIWARWMKESYELLR